MGRVSLRAQGWMRPPGDAWPETVTELAWRVLTSPISAVCCFPSFDALDTRYHGFTEV